jgi:hypothetical protein
VSPGSVPCGLGRWTEGMAFPAPVPGFYQVYIGQRSTSSPSHLPSSPHTFPLHRKAAGANSPSAWLRECACSCALRPRSQACVQTNHLKTARGPKVPRPVGRSSCSGAAGLPSHAPAVRYRAGALDITGQAAEALHLDSSAARARGVRLPERPPGGVSSAGAGRSRTATALARLVRATGGGTRGPNGRCPGPGAPRRAWTG